MLTFVGRAAARRLLASAAPSKLAFPALALRGVLPVRRLSVSAWLSLPEATKKAKSAATAAKKKATKKTAAGKKKAAPKKKKATAKKPKKPKKPKKKKVAAKKAKKPKKKVLTPEQKLRAEVRDLRKLALFKGPALLPDRAWMLYVSENLAKNEGKVTDRVRNMAAVFNRLPPLERERLEARAKSNYVANKQTREQWVKSQAPEAIYMANVARRRLVRKLKNGSQMHVIRDDRLPKRAGTPYTLFIKSRYKVVSQSSSEGSTSKDVFRTMAAQWKLLSDADKKPFVDMAQDEIRESNEQLKAIKSKAREYVNKLEGMSAKQVPP